MMTLGGCAHTPAIYVMKPSTLEAVRAGISTVGVSLSPAPPKTDVLLPAKGVLGGIKRGIVSGAALPVMLGFVSPVPGGTYLGLLAAPFSAIAGGIYGAFSAVPAEDVEHAETMLEIAADELRQMGLREKFLNSVIDLGNTRTNIEFVSGSEAPASPNMKGRAYQYGSHMDSTDANLEIRLEETGLRGNYSIDPPMDTFMRIHVQLTRSKDHTVVLDEHYTCSSEEERTFKAWADHEGADMIDEFKACTTELAEKIVDDFFRIYPLEWSHGDSF
jgi:hypothetical protein